MTRQDGGFVDPEELRLVEAIMMEVSKIPDSAPKLAAYRFALRRDIGP